MNPHCVGRREGSDAGDGHSSHGHQSNPSWMQHLGALGSVNSDVVNNPNVSPGGAALFMLRDSCYAVMTLLSLVGICKTALTLPL